MIINKYNLLLKVCEKVDFMILQNDFVVKPLSLSTAEMVDTCMTSQFHA